MSVFKDKALQASLPTVVATHAVPLPAVDVGRQRLVVAATGLFAEARSRSLHIRAQVASAPTPYGDLSDSVTAICGPIPMTLISEFVQYAMSHATVEVAALVEIGVAGTPCLRRLDSISSGAGHVTYSDRDIDDETLLIDLHSHGAFPARFSHQDNQSDLSRRGPYIAMVVGSCNTSAPQIAVRIVVAGQLVETSIRHLTEQGFLYAP